MGTILLLVIPVWFFYQPEALFFGASIQNPLFKYTGSLEWWVYIVFCLIAISFINVMIFTLLNIYFIFAKTREERITKHYEYLFAKYLIDYFFPEGIEDLNHENLLSRMKKRTKKKIQVITLFRIFIKIHENVSDNLGPKFMELAGMLNLGRKLEALLYSNNFSDNILAINVISSLGIKKYNNLILQYINSSNYALRTESISALIKLSDNNNLAVLSHYSHHLSLLDINVVVNVVLRNRKTDIDYLSLLHSGNVSKKLIAVILIRNRKLVEFKKEIIALIGHPDEKLNYELWEAYLAMEDENEMCIDIIIDKFEHMNEDIKSLILSKELNPKGPRYYDFIAEVIKKDESLAVKTGAMRLLFHSRFDLVSQFINSGDERIRKAYKEVVDFNI